MDSAPVWWWALLCWCYAWIHFSLNLPRLCSTALLKLFSWLLFLLYLLSLKVSLLQQKTERQRAREGERDMEREEGREGVTSLLMIWNHKCKCAPTNSLLPLHAKYCTAAADAGLSLSVINSTHIGAAYYKPCSFSVPLSCLKYWNMRNWQFMQMWPSISGPFVKVFGFLTVC